MSGVHLSKMSTKEYIEQWRIINAERLKKARAKYYQRNKKKILQKARERHVKSERNLI